MFPRLARMLAAFVTVAVMYSAYALIAVPLVEPRTTIKRIENITDDQIKRATLAEKRRQQVFGKYFSEGDWELHGNPKVLEANQAKLLVKDYENLPDGRVKLFPCTLIFFPKPGQVDENGDEQAIVMRAPEGAVLEFDSPLDLRSASIGKLVGGQLVGPITIASAPRSGGENDLLIATRDVQLDGDRIWTPNEVEFHLGQSVGRGRELKISLVKTQASAGKKGNSQFGEIEALELLRDVRLHIELPQNGRPGGGLFAAGNPIDMLDGDETSRQLVRDQDQQNNPQPATRELPVEVSCQGPFRFDVLRSLATFSDQVDVLRTNDGGPSDQLNCELLAIQFGPRAPRGPRTVDSELEAQRSPEEGDAAATPREPAKRRPFDLEPRRVEAVGDPVVIRAPSQGGSARCQRLEYDVRSGRIMLEGSQDISLFQGSNEVRTKRFDYTPGKDGRIGQLTVAGPGSFVGAAQHDPGRKYQAQWKNELRVRPQDSQDVLSLTGNAEVRYADMGKLAAEEIHLWLSGTILPPGKNSYTPPVNEAAASDPARSNATRVTAMKPRPSIAPDRLMAQGNVKIEASQLTGGTNRLEVWFRPGDESAAATSAEPGGATKQPVSRASQNGQQKFDVRGDLVRLQLKMGERLTRIADVTVEGQARFNEATKLKLDEAPMKVAGDKLHVAQADGDDARVDVAGRPATVEARGMTLSGATIQLDRATNRLWIDGPGRMKLPMDRDLNGRQLDRRQTMEVDWRGGMQFDGRTVVLDRTVSARGEHESLRTDHLELMLRRKVDFQNGNGRQANDGGQNNRNAASEIEQIVCSGGVALNQRAFDGTGQVSVDQIELNDIAINQVTGAIEGRGPGHITTVRRGGGGMTLGQPGTQPPPENANQLSYLNVRFEKGVGGNLLRREVTFFDNVRSVYGPVRDWKDQLSDDGLFSGATELDPATVLLTCDALTLRQMAAAAVAANAPAGKETIELEAAGNTLVEGQTFTARCAKMTYAEAKNLLVLEGNGSMDAQLFRQAQPGAATSQAAARRILYYRDTNRVEVDDARFLDLGQLSGDAGAASGPTTAPVSAAPRSSTPSGGNGTAAPRIRRR